MVVGSSNAVHVRTMKSSGGGATKLEKPADAECKKSGMSARYSCWIKVQTFSSHSLMAHKTTCSTDPRRSTKSSRNMGRNRSSGQRPQLQMQTALRVIAIIVEWWPPRR